MLEPDVNDAHAASPEMVAASLAWLRLHPDNVPHACVLYYAIRAWPQAGHDVERRAMDPNDIYHGSHREQYLETLLTLVDILGRWPSVDAAAHGLISELCVHLTIPGDLPLLDKHDSHAFMRLALLVVRNNPRQRPTVLRITEVLESLLEDPITCCSDQPAEIHVESICIAAFGACWWSLTQSGAAFDPFCIVEGRPPWQAGILHRTGAAEPLELPDTELGH
jgi:hypothetical protein